MSCSICTESFNSFERREQILPCLHTFCSICLFTLYGLHGSIICPVCRSVHDMDASVLPFVQMPCPPVPRSPEIRRSTILHPNFNAYGTILSDEVANYFVSPSNSVTWIIHSFSSKRLSQDKVESPAFFTHQHGYKFKFELYPNGHTATTGAFSLSLHLKLCKNDHDWSLEWPFPNSILFGVVNAASADCTCKKHFCCFSLNDCNNQGIRECFTEPSSDCNPAICMNILSEEESLSDFCQYDCLVIKAYFLEADFVIDLPDNLLNFLSISSYNILQRIGYNVVTKDYPNVIWVIENVSEKRNYPGALVSPTINLGDWGYTANLKAFLRGQGSGFGSHLSLAMEVRARDDADRIFKWDNPLHAKFGPVDMGCAGMHNANSPWLMLDRPCGRNNVTVHKLDDFMPLDALFSDLFILNDRLFISIIVMGI